MATPTMKTTTYLTTATAPKSDEQSASVALLALATIATDARTGHEKEVLLALHQQACIEQKHPAAALAVRDFWGVSAASTSRAPTVPSRPLPATRASVPPPATPCSLATPVMTKWPAPSTKRSSPAGTSGGLRARCHCQTPDGTALGAGSEGGHLGRPPGAVGALGARECEKGVSDTLNGYEG